MTDRYISIYSETIDLWTLQMTHDQYITISTNTIEETKLSIKYSNGIELTIRCQDHLIFQNNI